LAARTLANIATVPTATTSSTRRRDRACVSMVMLGLAFMSEIADKSIRRMPVGQVVTISEMEATVSRAVSSSQESVGAVAKRHPEERRHTSSDSDAGS